MLWRLVQSREHLHIRLEGSGVVELTVVASWRHERQPAGRFPPYRGA